MRTSFDASSLCHPRDSSRSSNSFSAFAGHFYSLRLRQSCGDSLQLLSSGNRSPNTFCCIADIFLSMNTKNRLYCPQRFGCLFEDGHSCGECELKKRHVFLESGDFSFDCSFPFRSSPTCRTPFCIKGLRAQRSHSVI